MFVLKSKYRKLENQLESVTKLKNHWQVVAETNFAPVLTKGEAHVLESCLFCANQSSDITPNGFRTPQLLKKLTDKGYLKRVKRGLYELTFVKND